MRTIYKYPIVVTDEQVIPMPRGAHILTALVQQGRICLWAEVEPDDPIEPRAIHIFGTGHPVPTVPLLYINSVIDGLFVWHIYERVLRDERVQ